MSPSLAALFRALLEARIHCDASNISPKAVFETARGQIDMVRVELEGIAHREALAPFPLAPKIKAAVTEAQGVVDWFDGVMNEPLYNIH